MAADAVIRLEDLGGPWKEHTAAEGAVDPTPTSCMRQAGIFDRLGKGAFYVGGHFQRGDAHYFVISSAASFPDEADAEAMVKHFTTQEYATCRAAVMTAEEVALPGAPEGSSYRVGEIYETDAGGGEAGYAGSVGYQFQATTDGRLQDANGFQQESLFRNGRTVTYLRITGAAAENDAPDLGQLGTDEITLAARKAIARASG